MTERTIESILLDDGRPNGVVRGMDRAAYFSISRMSASVLKTGMIGSDEIDVTAIRDAYEGTRPEPSAELQASFDSGTLTHVLTFEPERIVDAIAVWKGKVRAGREWADFQAANVGKLIMRETDVREVQHAVRELRSVPQVNELLRRKHDTELAVFGKVSRTYAKGLLDCVTTDDGPVTLIDLKTTSHGIDEHSVLRTIDRLHYAEQLGFYAWLYREATGIEIEAAYLLFISLGTNAVRLVRLTTAYLQFGLRRMTQAIESVERCIDADEWPTFFGSSIADIPHWNEEDLDIEGI